MNTETKGFTGLKGTSDVQKAQDKLRNLAIEIVGDIAKEQKLDLVANRSNVLVFRNQLDLTKIGRFWASREGPKVWSTRRGFPKAH